MHKTFISYHHQNDQDIKDLIIKKFSGDSFIDKSVSNGDINVNNSEETIMRTIREDFLADSTVTLVIVGTETAQRPFVNSEIQASLWGSNYNGLIAVVRDEIHDLIYQKSTCSSLTCGCGVVLRKPTKLYEKYIPELVRKNHKYDGDIAHFTDDQVFCSIVKYTDFMIKPEYYIDKAFNKRKKMFKIKKRLSENTPKIQPKKDLFGGMFKGLLYHRH